MLKNVFLNYMAEKNIDLDQFCNEMNYSRTYILKMVRDNALSLKAALRFVELQPKAVEYIGSYILITHFKPHKCVCREYIKFLVNYDKLTVSEKRIISIVLDK